MAESEEKKDRIGLCADCQFMRQMRSDRGSIFYFCELSGTDPAFPKYPRLPVLMCAGYKPMGRKDPGKK